MTLETASGTQRDRGATLRNLGLEAELLRITRLLEPIRVIALKGPLLTRQIYGNLSSRVSVDNDIIVPEASATQALRRLLDDGYAPRPFSDPVRQLARNERVALDHPSGHSLDLHISAFIPHIFSARPGVVEAHLEQVELHGHVLYRFDRPLAFVHQVAHFLQHRFEIEMLPHLAESWARWEDELPEDAIRRLAAETCSEEGLEFTLTAAARLVGLRRPPPTVRTTRARMVLQWLPPERLREGPGRGYQRGIALALLVRPSSIAHQVMASFVLPPDELAARYGEAPTARLHLRRAAEPLHALLGWLGSDLLGKPRQR